MSPDEIAALKAFHDRLSGKVLWEVEISPPGSTDPDNIRFLLFTNHYREVVGIGHEEMAGKTVFEAVDEPSATAVYKKYAECVRVKEPISYSEYLLLAGQWRWWQTKLEPLTTDGEVYRLIGTSEEITGIEARLKNAIAAQAMEVHYQPICQMDTLTPIGYEALIRWPGTGLNPNDFLPVAKKAGLMPDITALVLQQSAKTAAKVPDGLWVAININDGSFEEQLPKVVAAHNLNPAQIRFEVTEDTQMTSEILASLKRVAILGHLMELDDFGTEGANFALLSQINFYALKLDAQFVVEAWKTPNKAAVCRAAVQIATDHNPPLAVVAEGIETEADREFALSVGIRYGQGWLLGKPRLVPSCL